MRTSILLALAAILAPLAAAQLPTNAADYAVFRDEESAFAFHYPKTWAVVAPSNAQTRFKMVSRGGEGDEDVTIAVTPNATAKGKPPEAHFASWKANPEGMVGVVREAMRNPSVRLVASGETTLASQPAFYVVMDYTVSAAGYSAPVRQIQFITGRDGTNYTITMRGDPAQWATQGPMFNLLATRFALLPKM